VTGQTILHYEIRELLGEGGMGVVYKALDLKLNRLVALKFLPATFAASNETLERFAQEATALSLLNHPHIATIYDIHQVENRRFLVLEYLAGGTLKARLDSVTEEGKRLPIDEVLSYATQTAEGIAHAHRRGIIHRDIKTSNLMLTEEGRVKITDFGVAKLSRFSGGTTPGSLIGTVRYMSPEQAEGREVDARSDIFSFGVVLFELITGRMPFEAETQQALLVKIATLQAPALGAFRPNVPAELERIVAKMMMKKPSARYQSVDDVIVNLESLHASALGHTLTKTSRSARSTILNAPRSTKISVAVAAIIASLAGAYFYSHGPPRWARFNRLPKEKKLAVLPFHCPEDARTDAAFCNGAFELTASKLGQLNPKVLQVIPAKDILGMEVSTALDAHKIFGATIAANTTVKKADDKFVAILDLLDATNMSVLETADLEMRAAELSQLPDMLLEKIASILKVPAKPEQAGMSGLTSNARAYELYWRGRGLLQRYDKADQREEALKAFDEALALDPQYALAHAGRAEVMLRVFRLTRDRAALVQARRSCQQALALNDQLSAIRLTMGLIQVAAGEYADAIISFDSALKLQPDDPDVLRELGIAYALSHREREAEETLLRAIRLRTNDWVAYKDLGTFYYRTGRLEEALAQFKRAVDLTPDNYDAYGSLGGVYLKMENYDGAQTALRKSLELRPNEMAYSNLGTLYFNRRKFAQAAEVYQKVTRLNPNKDEFWGNLGHSYRWMGNRASDALQAYRKAIDLLQRDLKINENNKRARAMLAMYLSHIGENAQALVELKRATDSSTEDYLIKPSIVVYEQSGMRDEALAAAERASPSTLSDLEHSPELDELRKDPRYQKIVEKVRKSGATVSGRTEK